MMIGVIISPNRFSLYLIVTPEEQPLTQGGRDSKVRLYFKGSISIFHDHPFRSRLERP